MMMLIHRICMAFSGLGKFISVANEMSVKAAMLLRTSHKDLVKLSTITTNRMKGSAWLLCVWRCSLTCSAGSGQSF